MQLIESIKAGWAAFTGAGQVKAITGSLTIQAHNQIFPTWDSWKEIKAYKVLDDVYSVVNRLARSAASVPMYGYKMGAKNEQEDLPYEAPLAVFLRSLTYVRRLEMYTWLYLRGECFIYKEVILGANMRVEKVHFLNPSFISVVISDSFPEEIVRYRYQDTSRRLDFYLEIEDVIFLKYFNPDDDCQRSWRGLSPIFALKERLTRLKAGMDTSVAQLQNGGVPGVLYVKDLPANAASKAVVDAMKDNFSRFTNNKDNKGAPFIQAGNMDYIAMGTALADLGVAELSNIDFKKVCNAYQVSDVLFNSDSSSTESNVKEMRQMMWTNAVIPNLVMAEDAFNQELAPNFGSALAVRYDLGSIKDLQKNLKEVVESLAAAPVMIPNDVLEAMGYERSDVPGMNEPLIKTGYQSITDLEPVDPLEDE